MLSGGDVSATRSVLRRVMRWHSPKPSGRAVMLLSSRMRSVSSFKRPMASGSTVSALSATLSTRRCSMSNTWPGMEPRARALMSSDSEVMDCSHSSR